MGPAEIKLSREQLVSMPSFKQFESNTLTNQNPLEIAEEYAQEENPEEEPMLVSVYNERKSPQSFGLTGFSSMNLYLNQKPEDTAKF